MAARRPHFLDAVAGSSDAFELRLTRTGVRIARAHLAGTSAARRRGLLGRNDLAVDDALVIAPTQGIHTFGMRIVLDVVFVDRAGVVVKVAQSVPRRRVRLAWRAFAAIELTGGRATSVGLLPGDRLEAIAGPPGAD